MKLLTVTVPCYNSQDYMEKCIQSLLPGGNRVEIIIIDDGSKDNTGKIADEYARKFPDIVRAIHQENGGHGEGINQGLKHALEECERQGGVDMVVTNYYYVHSDGDGDRSINYSAVLPENRIFTWEDTKPFRVYQMLTIHSSTFRTEIMRKWEQPLPKHVFYEDNLMIYQTMPYVRKLYYLNADLYRYWIGRPDQSVQSAALAKRHADQILVTERCFTTCHLDDITEPRLKRYMKHDLFMMFGISILTTRLNKSAETDAELKKMWETCMAYDPKWANYFRKRTPLLFVSVPGRVGQEFAGSFYRFANNVVRFN